MSEVRAANEHPLPSGDREPYEPPRAEEIEVAAGTAEAATGAIVS
jgi:hypothetical protein